MPVLSPYNEGELIYSNDHNVKPGQLNNGSGTTDLEKRILSISIQVNRNYTVVNELPGLSTLLHQMLKRRKDDYYDDIEKY